LTVILPTSLEDVSPRLGASPSFLRAYVEEILFIRPKHEMDVMGFKPQSY